MDTSFSVSARSCPQEASSGGRSFGGRCRTVGAISLLGGGLVLIHALQTIILISWRMRLVSRRPCDIPSLWTKWVVAVLLTSTMWLIVIGQVMYSTTAREEALHLLEEHITENVVKVRRLPPSSTHTNELPPIDR
jgi:hypothetical protein